jgi:hypothetical protein
VTRTPSKDQQQSRRLSIEAAARAVIITQRRSFASAIATVEDRSANERSRVQLQTFTRWWNYYLEPRGLPVTDLCEQIRDGVLPFRLLEALEIRPTAPVVRGKISTYDVKLIAHPQLRVQRLHNMQLFLRHVTEVMGIYLVNIGAEDLEEGHRDLVLGLTWALIKAFEVGYVASLTFEQLHDSAQLCARSLAAPDAAADAVTSPTAPPAASRRTARARRIPLSRRRPCCAGWRGCVRS